LLKKDGVYEYKWRRIVTKEEYSLSPLDSFFTLYLKLVDDGVPCCWVWSTAGDAESSSSNNSSSNSEAVIRQEREDGEHNKSNGKSKRELWVFDFDSDDRRLDALLNIPSSSNATLTVEASGVWSARTAEDKVPRKPLYHHHFTLFTFESSKKCTKDWNHVTRCLFKSLQNVMERFVVKV